METLQLLVNGVLLGGMYALLGIGMTMIFGIVGLTNLAHGEFVILGAYASALLTQWLGVDPILTLAFTVPLMFLTGVLLQYTLFHRAMRKGQEAAMLAAFGVSIILQDAMLLLFSSDARHVESAYELSTLALGGIHISLLNLVLFLISLAAVGVLAALLNFTYVGRAIRAVSDDNQAAALNGVNVRKMYAIAMGIAMATAAVSGLCVGLKWTFYPSSGGKYLLISFIVVVIGGMGSIPGTLAAGLVFGLAQVIGGANYGMLISYLLLLLMLAIKPKGLLGQ